VSIRISKKGSNTVLNAPDGLDVDISHLNDSVRIGDGTTFVNVTANNELKVASVGITYTTRVDEASTTITYIGKAVVGTSEASAFWQIQRVSVSGSVSTFTYADGNENFDNIWNNRASLSYS
jgi:hypothetical protein